MKERVIMFGDAIVAIIITIMVLEVPIEFMPNGDVDFSSFFKTIGIYFISYCFVANIWFQTAYSFNEVDDLRNREILIYMMMLFLVSIVPSATRLLIEDTARETVFIYGVLTLIVMQVMQELNIILTKQWMKNPETLEYYIRFLRQKQLLDASFRIAILILGLFLIHLALVIYLILSIYGLLQNTVDREENRFITSLTSEDQLHYFLFRDRLWGDPRKRQEALLRSSLQDEENSTEGWVDFIDTWKNLLNQEISSKKELHAAGETTDQVHQDIEQLELQRDRLSQKQQNLISREERLKKQKLRKTDRDSKKEETIREHQERQQAHKDTMEEKKKARQQAHDEKMKTN